MKFEIITIGAFILGLPAFANAQNVFYYDNNRPPIIEVKIDNQPLRLAIDTGGPRAIMLNETSARKIKTKEKTIIGAKIAIDGQKIKGNVQRKELEFNGKKFSTWIGWFPKYDVTKDFPKLNGLDGIIGIGALYDLGQINLINKNAGAKATKSFKFNNKFVPYIQEKQDGYVYNIALDLLRNSNLDNNVGDYFISSGKLSEDGEIRTKQTLYLNVQKQTRRLRNNGITLLGITPQYFDIYLKNKQYDGLLEEDNAKAKATEEGKDFLKVSGKIDPKKPIGIAIGSEILNNCAAMNFNLKKSKVDLACY